MRRTLLFVWAIIYEHDKLTITSHDHQLGSEQARSGPVNKHRHPDKGDLIRA